MAVVGAPDQGSSLTPTQPQSAPDGGMYDLRGQLDIYTTHLDGLPQAHFSAARCFPPDRHRPCHPSGERGNMPMLADQIDHVIGVDTHKLSYTAAVVDPNGARVAVFHSAHRRLRLQAHLNRDSTMVCSARLRWRYSPRLSRCRTVWGRPRSILGTDHGVHIVATRHGSNWMHVVSCLVLQKVHVRGTFEEPAGTGRNARKRHRRAHNPEVAGPSRPRSTNSSSEACKAALRRGLRTCGSRHCRTR